MGNLFNLEHRPCFIVIILLLLPFVMAYKPVIIVHGLFDGPSDFQVMEDFITQAHPGTNVTRLSLYNDLDSLKPMWQQVNSFREAVRHIMDEAEDGVHLICFSQGGLICRGIIATLPTHNTHSLIVLSSPLAGQYGETSYFKNFFPTLVKSHMYKFCYTELGQKLSVCNYWNDPHHRESFKKESNFLAPLNCEVQLDNLPAWKERFLRIQKLVLIGGPDDGVISPWQSSLFGFYDDNENVVEMENQSWYLSDSFGLKTLDLKGAVVKYTVPGVEHTLWHSNFTVYQNYIDKWLT